MLGAAVLTAEPTLQVDEAELRLGCGSRACCSAIKSCASSHLLKKRSVAFRCRYKASIVSETSKLSMSSRPLQASAAWCGVVAGIHAAPAAVAAAADADLAAQPGSAARGVTAPAREAAALGVPGD